MPIRIVAEALSLFFFVYEIYDLTHLEPLSDKNDNTLVVLIVLRIVFAAVILPGLFLLKLLQYLGWIPYKTKMGSNVFQFQLFGKALYFVIALIIVLRTLTVFLG